MGSHATPSSEQARIKNEDCIAAVVQGLENRWAYSDEECTTLSKRMVEDDHGSNQCEQDAIAGFNGKEFEVKALADRDGVFKRTLESFQVTLITNEVSADLLSSKWIPTYITRATVLTDFSNDYELSVGDEHKCYLKNVFNDVSHLTFADQSAGEHSFTVLDDAVKSIGAIAVFVQELAESSNVLSTTALGDIAVVQFGQSVTVQDVLPEGTASAQVYGLRYINRTVENGSYVEGLLFDVPLISF